MLVRASEELDYADYLKTLLIYKAPLLNFENTNEVKAYNDVTELYKNLTLNKNVKEDKVAVENGKEIEEQVKQTLQHLKPASIRVVDEKVDDFTSTNIIDLIKSSKNGK